jgi:hypothetical protein
MTKPFFHRAPPALKYADLPNGDDDLEHDAIAQTSLTDRNETWPYLERGRRFERLATDDLNVLWTAAFEDVARGDRKRLGDFYDLKAEVKLRNLAGDCLTDSGLSLSHCRREI